MNPLLELDNVHAYYGDALILDGVSFHVDAGEAVGLLGRNGAGKTTSLLSVFGVPDVRKGEIRVEGSPLGLDKQYEAASRGVSLVPQGRRIFPNLTVMENLLLGKAPSREGNWTVDTVLDLFPNLTQRTALSGSNLSGGEQQMLAIGRALMSNPKLLLLDEPSEGLAPILLDQVAEVLREIRDQGTALLLVEQNIAMVEKLATRFVALSKGNVVADGSVDELASREIQELIAL